MCVTACGRLGFDVTGSADGGSTDGTDDGAGASANKVFITAPRLVGAIGTLAAADTICNDEATAAGIPGTYRAWLSTSTEDAIDRIRSGRGWVRVDGQPFADTADDIAAGRIFLPVGLTAAGTPYRGDVMTGTGEDGRYTANNCDDFASSGSPNSITFGSSVGTTGLFSYFPGFLDRCDTPAPMYCFGIDRDVAVAAPAPVSGKLMFIVADFTPGGGVAAANNACAGAASAAGLSGTFRAVLSTSTSAASAGFSAASGPVVRRDGFVVAQTVGEMFAGNLTSPPNITLGGIYLSGAVWSGSTVPTSPSAVSCGNWTTSLGTGMCGFLGAAEIGSFGTSESGLGQGMNCASTLPIYCLEL